MNKTPVYILIRCPECGDLIEKYPPDHWDAVSDRDMFGCQKCKRDFIIRFEMIGENPEFERWLFNRVVKIVERLLTTDQINHWSWCVIKSEVEYLLNKNKDES